MPRVVVSARKQTSVLYAFALASAALDAKVPEEAAATPVVEEMVEVDEEHLDALARASVIESVRRIELDVSEKRHQAFAEYADNYPVDDSKFRAGYLDMLDKLENNEDVEEPIRKYKEAVNDMILNMELTTLPEDAPEEVVLEKANQLIANFTKDIRDENERMLFAAGDTVEKIQQAIMKRAAEKKEAKAAAAPAASTIEAVATEESVKASE